MEQVFPVEMSVSSPKMNLNKGSGPVFLTGFKEGIIEKILEPGNFIVTLADGLRVKARGSEALKPGNKVRIQLPAGSLKGTEALSDVEVSKSGIGNGFQWSALIPLGFGGKGAIARLEVFVERRTGGGREKNLPALYFVFTVQTEEKGEIQWSIHLKGRQVMIQVYAQVKENQKEDLRNLIQGVEKSLKNKGFVLTNPTVFLSRPFKIPAGFRLNVRG